jgi:hypothetical protein
MPYENYDFWSRTFDFPWNCPDQALGQFFQFQCIQSSDPSIPGNPHFAPFVRSRSRSAVVGGQRYLAEWIPTIASQNLSIHFTEKSVGLHFENAQ